MRNRYQFDIERPDIEPAAKLHHTHVDLRRTGLGFAFRFDQRRRERRCIHRHVEPRPQIEQGAEMILVRMGQHDAGKMLALLNNVRDIGQDQVDTRQIVARKCNTKIDGQPGLAAWRAQTIQREIHADLADAAERRKHQFVAGVRHQACSALAECIGNTSPAAMASRDPSASRNSR